MSQVLVEKKDEIAVLRLSNGTINAIGPVMVDALAEALESIRHDCKGMVLCGGEKFFCIGLDLPTLLPLAYDQMREFWYKFNKLIFDIYTLPMPTACALCGHAPGAGAILALACDFRFAAEEKVLIGFNEIQLGIPVPYLADMMLRKTLVEHEADDLLFSGKLITSQEAININLAHGRYPKHVVEKKASEQIERIAGFSGQAFASMKRTKTESICSAFDKNQKKQHEIFLDSWFSEHAQGLLKGALKNF